jgi:hypothetical protein
MAAAVANADHCQIGPLGGRTLADLRGKAFSATFEPAPLRLLAFIVQFFDAASRETLFFLITAFFAALRLPSVRDVKGAGGPCRGGWCALP